MATVAFVSAAAFALNQASSPRGPSTAYARALASIAAASASYAASSAARPAIVALASAALAFLEASEAPRIPATSEPLAPRPAEPEGLDEILRRNDDDDSYLSGS